jgi:MFS superfamily sulfate permease-like transporter
MHILLDADAVNFIDTSACDALANVTRQLRIQGIAFAFAPVRDSVREQMRLGGVEAAVEPANFYERVTDGVRAWQQRALLRQASGGNGFSKSGLNGRSPGILAPPAKAR